MQSGKYRRFLIGHQEGLLKDDVTKISEIALGILYIEPIPGKIGVRVYALVQN